MRGMNRVMRKMFGFGALWTFAIVVLVYVVSGFVASNIVVNEHDTFITEIDSDGSVTSFETIYVWVRPTVWLFVVAGVIWVAGLPFLWRWAKKLGSRPEQLD